MPLDLPSRLDLFALARDFVLQRARRIDPAQVDVAGSDVNIIVGSSSVMAYQTILQLAERTNALLLDGSTGEDLDRLAFDRYQIARKGAAAAVGTVRFFRTSAAAGAGTVPVGTILNTLTGIQYVTTTISTFGATDLEAFADVRAVTAGKLTQAGANSIRRFQTPGGLFDPSLQVNNDDPTAGGEDAETDDIFRERIRDFFNTARRGTLAAIEFGAKTVPGVVSAQAVESLTGAGQPARVVTLFIADSSGVASAALGNVVVAALSDFRAAGIAVIVSTSVPQIVTVKLALTFRAGVDTTTLTVAIRTALVEFINGLAVNATLFRGQLFSVLQRFEPDGLIPNIASVVEPTGDLVPDTGKTLRTTLDTVVLA